MNATTTKTKYRVGSRIQYYTLGCKLRTVTVTHRDADIKDGSPGFDGTTDDGEDVWGYDGDIARVVTF